MANTWTDGKPHVADEGFCAGKYGITTTEKRAHCAICGHIFAIGDTYRWVYMNGASPSPGNFFVCPSCDAPDLADRVSDALRRHKPHMDEWVLLYLLEKTRAVARAVADEAWGTGVSESLHFERMAKMDALRAVLKKDGR